ncbi:MAG: hypothetical protein MJZ60_04275, partial [Bacteroidaceae bacterium]|nr:hypothetical protein [Bacteroidaceae bacterium]
AEAPIDATFMIKAANFNRSQYTQAADAAWTVEAGCTNKNLTGGANENMCAESFHSPFNIHQVIDVPNGVYALIAQGFYRQDGADNDNMPVFYANEETQQLPLKTGAENSMADASKSFTNGEYTISPIFVKVEDGKLDLGVKNENASLWCIWDNFELSYYGAEADVETLKLASYVAKLAELKAEAEAIEGKMGATEAEDLAAAKEVEPAKTVEAYNEAIDQLSSAVSAAKNSVAAYAKAKAVAEFVSANAEAAGVDVAEAAEACAAAYEAGTLDTAAENPVLAAYNAAVKAAVEAAEAVEDVIANPNFEVNGVEGWTTAEGWANSNPWLHTSSSANFGIKNGTNFVEGWVAGPAKHGDEALSQEITLPAGNYILTAEAQNLQQGDATVLPGGFFIFAGDNKAEVTNIAGTYAVKFTLEEEGAVVIGAQAAECTGNWLCIDNFKLYSVPVPEVFEGTKFELSWNGMEIPADALKTYNFGGQWQSMKSNPADFDPANDKKIVIKFAEPLADSNWNFGYTKDDEAKTIVWNVVEGDKTGWEVFEADVTEVMNGFFIQNTGSSNSMTITESYVVKNDESQVALSWTPDGWGPSISVSGITSGVATISSQWAGVNMTAPEAFLQDGTKTLRIYANADMKDLPFQWCLTDVDGQASYPAIGVDETGLYAEFTTDLKIKSLYLQHTSTEPHTIDIKAITWEFKAAAAELEMATVTIEKGEKSIVIKSSNAEYALQTKFKPVSELEEGETPESTVTSIIEEMAGAFATAQEFEDYFVSMATKGEKEIDLEGIEEVYPAGTEFFVAACNIAWDPIANKVALASNVAVDTYVIPAAPVVEPANLDELVGTVVSLKNTEGQYIYGKDAQNTGVGTLEESKAESNTVVAWKVEKAENGYLLRAVTPAGGDYALWGASVCYFNAQPNVGGVTFILGKDQDAENGSTWQFFYNEEKGGYAMQCVANNGYCNGATTSEEAQMWFTFEPYDATGIAAISSVAKDGKFLQNGKIVIVKNGKAYNTVGARIK